MKAMILAAGYGKRLRPFSETTPKVLFPIAGRPIIDRTIQYLQQSGCHEVIVNVHYLGEKIEAFLSHQTYDIPVHVRYETELLGTGGAIKNVADFWDNQPFMVINSDIVTDVDLKELYHFHLHHPHPVTLVLFNDKEFNTVSINAEGYITGFDTPAIPPHTLPDNQHKLTFTGIQVLNPEVLEMIPDHQYSSIIDTYEQVITSGNRIKAYVPQDVYWKDIGTPERYRQVVYDHMVIDAFKVCFPGTSPEKVVCEKLTGDGSDRTWYRLTSDSQTLILADHGIRRHSAVSEVDSFVAIGSHLRRKGVPVPRIYHQDTFPGLVFVEDLGDVHLQTLIQHSVNTDIIISHYQSVIRLLIHMALSAGTDFNPSWAYQTPVYDKGLILEKECQYFVDAFLKCYLNLKPSFDDFSDEFSRIADQALEVAIGGFMHRDFQSRNIMVKDHRYYVIDFQGGRIGPLQYDLASLLIDPYVGLSYDLQELLVGFCIQQLSSMINVNPFHFHQSYSYCRVTRNLQMLGAFGYLTRVKGKTAFEQYVPQAIKTLKHYFSVLEPSDFPKLKTLIDRL